MKARPILFSAVMVRELLSEGKTQTRRPLKDVPTWLPDSFATDPGVLAKCRYGAKGDVLWVREAYQVPALMDVQYRATPGPRHGHWDPEFGPWKPSIHMPRWASRLTLLITEVRIERLQNISEEDAIAEGIERIWPESVGSDTGPNHFTIELDTGGALGWHNAPTAVGVYQMLWEHINNPRYESRDANTACWDANPWVWVVSFKVYRQNVDEFLQAEGP